MRHGGEVDKGGGCTEAGAETMWMHVGDGCIWDSAVHSSPPAYRLPFR